MFGFAGRWRPLLYCVFAFYESNLTYVTVLFITLNLLLNDGGLPIPEEQPLEQ